MTERSGHVVRYPVRRAGLPWIVGVLLILVVCAVPIVAIIAIAIKAENNIWPHLASTVLPRAAIDTALLLLGVGLVTLITGTGTAWLVTMYRFKGSRILAWALMLPLAMPTYIIAYCYVEILDYSGPVQSTLRASMGWQNARDYWFPEIRSLPGAVFVISAVLYPYVYLTARSAFLAQSVCVLDVSRTLGAGPWRTVREVAMPLARPALVAGVTIALMETLNDIGAVEFFGVRTLTVTIYSTWLGRGSLSGAAQLACILLVIVLLLLWLERWSRKHRKFHHTSSKYHGLPTNDLHGMRGALAILCCLIPVLAGFFIPAMLLVGYSIARIGDISIWPYLELAGNSIFLSVSAAITAVGTGLVLVYAPRIVRMPNLAGLSRFAAIGYAVPGTVLAIGILIPLAALDNVIANWSRETFGYSTGLLLSGTVFALILAYTIRFLAISHGAIEAGLGKVNPNLTNAARTLGQSAGQTLKRVDIPLIRPALVTAGILVFVDAMKELPATLLLRPFNFETLASHVYSYASIERFEDAALPALTIVAVGLIPVIALNATLRLAFRSDRKMPDRLPTADLAARATIAAREGR